VATYFMKPVAMSAAKPPPMK